MGAGVSELIRPPNESCHRLDCPTGEWARQRGHHGSIPQGYEAKIFPQSPNEVPKDASGKQWRVSNSLEARCAASQARTEEGWKHLPGKTDVREKLAQIPINQLWGRRVGVGGVVVVVHVQSP